MLWGAPRLNLPPGLMCGSVGPCTPLTLSYSYAQASSFYTHRKKLNIDRNFRDSWAAFWVSAGPQGGRAGHRRAAERRRWRCVGPPSWQLLSPPVPLALRLQLQLHLWLLTQAADPGQAQRGQPAQPC